ncbi:lipopolysaccharide biosynthesis protein [Mucilaginibacter sp. Bleaf8]|uniref:GumC family protein n=1 Tax=Mucilaginibacter sp. Bleaf8 TaxID=2834430 RepID=UPI001BCE83E4|nr:Wzz/FepE/Etk N-terminal domain-containing protein [Mucilaginibacter sp. Bleaf8]MBS7564200.1 lipopolysaccharide biosynthesis protein [Mucilaginibacter sp. Bleaf8]
MELSSFIKVLRRHRYTLILIPLVTVIITYFLVRNQPDSYVSDAQIATGIVDETQQAMSGNSNAVSDTKIAQQFSNLLAMIKSKRVLDQVSYQLMIHDLTDSKPFKKPSKLLNMLNASAKTHALQVYKNLYSQREPLSLFNPDQKGMYSLMGSMKYDDESLLQKLSVYRSDNSDYIYVSFDSPDPILSAFVVNTLIREFITYYTSLVKENQRKAVTFYGRLLQTKQDTLDKRMEALKNYKIKNRILNLDELARSIYGQISDYETKRQEAEKDAVSNAAAISDIDRQFDPADRRYLESSMLRINQQIVGTRNQLQALNNEYIQNGFDPSYKSSIDSLQRILNVQIARASDKYIVNPLSNKQDLIRQKLTLEVTHDLAKNSIGSIQKELSRLNNRLNTLTPHEAVIQADESSIQIARDEYMDVLNRYNQTSLESNFSSQLRQIQTAMPGAAQPSKKMLLVIISGVVSFVFCVVVLFVLFYMDNSIKNPREMANATKISVLGYLHRLSGATLDLGRIWHTPIPDAEIKQFKNLLQSIRFEVDNELNGTKTLLINSMSAGEGRTFLSLNLAYAYSLVNKKVLLIDGDFAKPDITEAVKPKTYLEDYLIGGITATELAESAKIAILGNKGGDISVLEVSTADVIRARMDELKEVFDIILIKSSPLDTLNKAKEWTVFTDKVLTVFKAGQTLKGPKKLHAEYLKSLDGQFIGWVLNEVAKDQVAAS